MALLLIPALLLALGALAFLWWRIVVFLPAGRRRGGGRSVFPVPLASAWIMQVSAAIVLSRALWLTSAGDRLDMLVLALSAAFPPVGIFALAWTGQHLLPGICEVAAMPVLKTGLGLGLGLALLWMLGGIWRKWGLFAALILAAWALLAQMDASAARLIRERARAFHADCLQMSRLRDSLRFAGREIQTDLHALVFRDGVAYGWSYRDAGFYPIPRGYWGKLDEKACMSENDLTQTRKGSP